MIEIVFSIAFGFVIGFLLCLFLFANSDTNQINKNSEEFKTEKPSTDPLQDSSLKSEEIASSQSKLIESSRDANPSSVVENLTQVSSFALKSEKIEISEIKLNVKKIYGYDDNANSNYSYFNDSFDGECLSKPDIQSSEDDSSDTESKAETVNPLDILNNDETNEIENPLFHTTTGTTVDQSSSYPTNISSIFEDILNNQTPPNLSISIPEEDEPEEAYLETLLNSEWENTPDGLLEGAYMVPTTTENLETTQDIPKSNLELYMQDDGILYTQKTSTAGVNKSYEETHMCLVTSDLLEENKIPATDILDLDWMMPVEESFGELIADYDSRSFTAEQFYDYLALLNDDYYSIPATSDNDAPHIEQNISFSTEVTT